MITKLLKFVSKFFANLLGRPSTKATVTQSSVPALPAIRKPDFIEETSVDGNQFKKRVFTLPAIPCRVLGKHRVGIQNGNGLEIYKVFGPIRPNGVNRIRLFGHRGMSSEVKECRLSPI